MATLAQGQAVKLHCAISQAITVTPSTGGRATISANGPGNVSYAQKTISAAETFGPYLSDTDVVIAAVAGSLSYDLGTASLVDGAGNNVPLAIVHRNLWAQFSATKLCADDGSVLDLSGNANHATRGPNLSIAQMNAAPGYFQTLLAGTNGHDPSLHMPSINFDYDGGEILLMVSLFKMAAPAADGVLVGNATSSSFNGFRIRIRTTGYLDVGMFSTTGSVSFASGNCINALLDNTLHQFAVMISGRTKQGWMWEDGALTRATVAFPATCDTRESTSLNFGSALQTPTVIAHTSATQQRGTVIMRWSPTDPAPAEANITSLLAKLRRDPGRVVTVSDL